MSSSALLLLSEPVDTSGHLHVLQTSPTYLHKDDIPPSELSYLEGLLHEHHTIDVDCSSTLFTCFLKSKPTIEFDGDVYLLTWTVTQSIAYIMLVGNVYLLQWQGIMTSRAVRAFHHILHLVNVTDLPKLAMFQQPLDDAAATIVTRAARPIKLPLNSTFQQFKDMDLSPLGVPPVTYPIRSRFCMVHPYRDMLRAYDNQSLTSRVGHRIHGSGSGSGGRTFISPYSAYLGRIDLSALYSGGLLIGDPMSGKTRLLLEMAKESQQHTIYVFKPFDSFRLSQVCDELQIEFLIVDSAADVPSDDDGDAVTIMFVTMTKLETKQDLVAALNTWTHNQPSRLIVDHFESYKRRSLERIQALNCDRVWGISSLFKVEHWPLAYRVLRFPVDMPSDYYANIAFLYTLCVYVTADHVEPRLLTHTVPRNENEYPYTQVRVAVRETLATTQRAQGSAKIKALVECILKLDSGVVMNQDEVMRSLLYHSNNKRPGGGVYRPLPPLEDLAHGPLIDATNAQPDAEPDALAPCAICLESTPLNPIRNSACSHVLCFACLDAWNVVNSSCPCCRAVYTDTFINLQPTGTKWKKRKAASLMAASYYNVKDNARFRVLRQAILAVKPLLTDGKYVLVITHFSDMLSEYEDIVVAALDKDESCIFQPPRGLDSLRGCKVVVCHSRHISWLRSDPNVLTVLLMDVNMNTSTIETWFRYFAGAIDKKHLHDGYGIAEVTIPKGSILQECPRTRVIKSDQLVIENFNPIDYSTYLTALRKDIHSFEFVNPQVIDRRMCDLAIELSPSSIAHVPPHLLTNEMCMRAVRARAPLQRIPVAHRTDQVCAQAVELDGTELRNVPCGLRTFTLCRLAVRQNPLAFQWVPKAIGSKYNTLLNYVLERDPSLRHAFTDDSNRCVRKQMDDP